MIEGLAPAPGGGHGNLQHLLELLLADVIRQALRPQPVFPSLSVPLRLLILPALRRVEQARGGGGRTIPTIPAGSSAG